MPIDLNADLGAGCAGDAAALDDLVAGLATSVNIPCGAHAGDPVSMLTACAAAVAADQAIGALVGYRDPFSGGRRFIDYAADDLTAEIIYQLGALDGLALTEGGRISFIRPAGALMDACLTDRHHAWAIVNAVLDYDPNLIVVGPESSSLVVTAERHGLPTAIEFAPHRPTRASADPSAIITDPALVADRAIEAAESGRYATIHLPSRTPVRDQLARSVRDALTRAGHEPRQFARSPR